MLALAASATAQEPTPVATAGPAGAPVAQPAAPEPEDEETGWELGLSGALQVLPDEEDFVQPTFQVDRGLLGFALERLDGTVCFFNPGADDHFAVVSLGVSF